MNIVKKNTQSKVALATFIILVAAYLVAWVSFMSYIPRKESGFLFSISSHFATSENPIQIEKLTNFSWDRVCIAQIFDSTVRAPRLTRPEAEKILGVDLSSYEGRLPVLERHWLPITPLPTYSLAFIFIEENMVKETYKFKNTSVKVRGEFLYITNWEKPFFCMSHKEAAFYLEKRDIIPTTFAEKSIDDANHEDDAPQMR